jgi:hypothetical protein
LLATFVIRGLLRGTIAQVFALFGVLLGVLAASLVADWIGPHWRAARPAFFFTLLRWLVACIVGFGVSAWVQWWGGLLAKATHQGPFGWLDRVVGALVGFAVGTLVCAAVVVFLLQAPGLEFARPIAARGVTSRPLLAAGDRASEWSLRLPGGIWLHEQLRSASRRMAGRRQS